VAKRPTLYVPLREGGRHATWLELFFDLVFVLAIAELARYLHDHLTVGGFLGFLFLFVPVWGMWMGYTYYADLFDVDGPAYRVAMLAAMLLSIALAVSVHGALDGGSSSFVAALALALALVGIALSPPVLVGLLALALAGLTAFEVAYARQSSGASGATAPRRWTRKGS
jgi:low temperature requirement protein LtrA